MALTCREQAVSEEYVDFIWQMNLGEEELKELKPECVVIDLASLPGGVDFAAAQALGVKAIQALSLPGRVAPATAAAYLRSTICHILNELGV